MTLEHSAMARKKGCLKKKRKKKGCFKDVTGRAKRTKPRDVPTGEVVII